MFERFISFVQDIYGTTQFISLHEPRFFGNEKKYLVDTVDSTFVSSVGAYVDKFENDIAAYTGAGYAIATVNGTAALHIALILAGVTRGDEVVTQSLTFVATCNAIRYCDAEPVFIDVDRETLGLSPECLLAFIVEYCEIRDDGCCWNKASNRPVRACVPMHSFGMPVKLNALKQICNDYNIVLVEDAAESLGSYYQGHHTGTVGKLAALSFNGNKIITTGGGGMVLTDNEALAKRAKHLTTTAKIPHKWAFDHDETGYNYRLPNLNAALGVAQLQSLPLLLESKRDLAARYQAWGIENGMQFVVENQDSESNYWLNAVITSNGEERDALLRYTNDKGVMTRPVWTPMHKLPMNQHCQADAMINTQWLYERVVNVPSSALITSSALLNR